MKDKYFVLSLGVGFSFRGQQVMRAFGPDVSIYNRGINKYKEKVVRTQVPDDKRASNHENINKNYNKIGSKFLLLRGCYPLSFNLLEIGESKTFAKLGVKRAGPLRFSPGMDVVFLLLLALALTLDGSPVATAKQSSLFFPQITLSIRRGRRSVRGEKSFLHVSPKYHPEGGLPYARDATGVLDW